jgi:hypothetical protein
VPAARVESRVKTKTTSAASIHKVRRDVVGGKRGQGHKWQQAGRKIRRPDPAAISAGAPNDTLTGMGGLVAFADSLGAWASSASFGRSSAD